MIKVTWGVYSLIKNKQYVEYLKKIKKDDFPGFELENYVRRWTLPLTQYGRHYDYCDVCGYAKIN